MARTPNSSSNDPEKSTEKQTPESSGAAKSETSASSGAASGGNASNPNAASNQSESKATGQDRSAANHGEAIVGRLKGQHRALQAALDKRSAPTADAREIARQFAAIWVPHELIVRDVFGSAPQKLGETAETLAASQIRKDLLNFLLVNLLEEGRGAQRAELEALANAFAALLRADEEDGFLEVVASTIGSAAAVSQIESRFERARQRFERLDDNTIGEAIELLAPRRLSVPGRRQRNERERYDMARYSSQSRDRDEQGRFTSDDEREYGRSGGGYRGGTPQRDEAGRFLSDDDRRGRGRYEDDERRSRSRDDDDDRRSGNGGRGRGQSGQSGWFGDSEGHSEASRRGWERSDHGESGWFGDREGHSEASRRGWENPDHGRSGWFGDREGHSEASRRGWENSDHGQSGWYGDREGHSEASRRGWDEGHRSQRRDEDDNGRRMSERSARHESDDRRGGYESRRGGRYEDDERSGSSRSHSGWSGDPEGHSEASRRGWERRR